MIDEINAAVCHKGCTICYEICPTDVIRMDGATGKAYIKYQRDCITCFICALECPVGAIFVGPFRKQTRHSFPVVTRLVRAEV